MPVIARGIRPACTGVGCEYPARWTASSVAAERPRESNSGASGSTTADGTAGTGSRGRSVLRTEPGDESSTGAEVGEEASDDLPAGRRPRPRRLERPPDLPDSSLLAPFSFERDTAPPPDRRPSVATSALFFSTTYSLRYFLSPLPAVATSRPTEQHRSHGPQVESGQAQLPRILHMSPSKATTAAAKRQTRVGVLPPSREQPRGRSRTAGHETNRPWPLSTRTAQHKTKATKPRFLWVGRHRLLRGQTRCPVC